MIKLFLLGMLKYLVVAIAIAALAIVGVFIGKKLRELKDSKKKTIEE